MLSPYLSLVSAQEEADRKVNDVRKRFFTSVELCKVLSVDLTSKTVSAFFFSSGATRDRVPYSYSSYNSGTGIISVPTTGSIGVAAWDSNGIPIIIAFTAPVTTDEFNRVTRNIPALKSSNIPDLLEGEVLISSSGRSFMKFDSLGGVRLSSSLFASIYLDEDGNGVFDLENGILNINGTIEENYTEEFFPVLKVVKGRHTYTPVQGAGDSVELCYRLSVLNHGVESFIGVDMSGNLHIKGKIIPYE